MADLVDEIKEDIRQEKYASLWKSLGNYVIGGAIAIIAITAGFVLLKNYNITQYEEHGNILYGAFSNESGNNIEIAVKEYSSLANKEKAVYSAIANMRKASLFVKEGKNSEATGIYKDISEDETTPSEIKELSEIIYLQNAIEVNNDHSLLSRLQELAKGQGAFKHSAQELLAFSKLKAGEYKEAKKIFEDLSSDVKTPTRMRGRSEEMINAINTKDTNSNG